MYGCGQTINLITRRDFIGQKFYFCERNAFRLINKHECEMCFTLYFIFTMLCLLTLR